jgi:argininosuccinate lyase
VASRKLWDKGHTSDELMLRYTARDDWHLDARLVPYDLRATRAHVRGLGRVGALSADEVAELEHAIEGLLVRAERGDFVPQPDDEDGHSAIENALVALLGDVGKKAHLGRSRNDQVLVALRLYQRDVLDELGRGSAVAAGALLDLAEREVDTPMPGYTHLQQAVPSSLALWAASIAEGLLDARLMLSAARALVDRSPLGAAAGYGVNLALDRAGAARELGFAAVALNPLASQASRGVHEAQVLLAAWQACAVLRRFAWDVSLWCTREFGFVTLSEELTTGSSIMPNKRNPDVVELMRAGAAVVEGALVETLSLLSLPSGYHRDFQLSKAPLFRGLDEALATVAMAPRVIAGMSFDRERMRAAIGAECFATDRAVDLAVAGMPFRDAYREVARELGELAGGDALASLKARVSPGAPGALGLEVLRRRLRDDG